MRCSKDDDGLKKNEISMFHIKSYGECTEKFRKIQRKFVEISPEARAKSMTVGGVVQELYCILKISSWKFGCFNSTV